MIPLFASCVALAFCAGFAIGVIGTRRYIAGVIRSCANCHYRQYLREFKEDMLGSSEQRVVAHLREDVRRKRFREELRDIFPGKRDPRDKP